VRREENLDLAVLAEERAEGEIDALLRRVEPVDAEICMIAGGASHADREPAFGLVEMPERQRPERNHIRREAADRALPKISRLADKPLLRALSPSPRPPRSMPARLTFHRPGQPTWPARQKVNLSGE